MRTVTSDFNTALNQYVIRPAIFLQFDSLMGTHRYWTGFGDIGWYGQTWIGDATFRGYSEYGEQDQGNAMGVEVYLSAANQSILELALAQIRARLPLKLWFALLTQNGLIIADPHLFFPGLIDKVELEDSVSDPVLTITAENRLSTQRGKELRYTDGCQRSFYPEDGGFKYTPQMEDWAGHWGLNAIKPKKKTASQSAAERARKASRRK